MTHPLGAQGENDPVPVGVIAVMGSSAVQRTRRQLAVAEARHSIEMEGGRVSDAAEADAARYVTGELSSEELLERVHRRVAGSQGSAASGG